LTGQVDRHPQRPFEDFVFDDTFAWADASRKEGGKKGKHVSRV